MGLTNTQRKLRIANRALDSLGQKRVSSLTDGSVDANRISDILEDTILEMMDEDWAFSRHRVPLSDLTSVIKLTVDSSPSPAAFALGATLTGASSGVTCTVKRVVSSTVYWVTEPSGDWTDGESITDGTNTLDCASGYPTEDDYTLHDNKYGFVIPSDKINLRFVADIYTDKIKYKYDTENDMIFCYRNDAVLVYNRLVEESAGVADVTLMPVWFWRLISARIAYLLAPNITENQRIRSEISVEWDEAQINALEKDADNTYHDNQDGNSDWIEGYEKETLDC